MRPFDRRQIIHALDVLTVLIARDQKSRYKSTAMGVVWAVASPLLFLLIFYFLFAVIMPLGIANYASHVLVGIVVWTWFQTSLSEAVTCIPHNATLVNLPRFPVAVLPVAAVLSNGVTFLMTFPILLSLVWVQAAGPSLPYLALPMLMLVQTILTLGLGYFVAALNVSFRDMRYIVPILLQLGYFLTPIFYDVSMVSERGRMVLSLNPLVALVTAYRAVLIEGRWPDWGAVAAVFVFALLLLALTLRFFRRSSDRFLEEI